MSKKLLSNPVIETFRFDLVNEEGQTIGDVTLPFSDHHEVRAALAERAS